MRQMTFRDAIREALREEMLRDESVFIMGEDVGRHGNVFKVTEGLYSEFGEERVRDTPIAESAIAGLALGAAAMGGRPVAEIMFIDFCTMAMDPIVNQMAKMYYHSGGQIKLPVVIRTQGGFGKAGGSQHSQSLEAWFAHTPGLIVVMPSTPSDAKGLLKTAIRCEDPVIFIEHKALYSTIGPVPKQEQTIPLGKAEIKKKGEDITIVATSRQVLNALKAAKNLLGEGIDAEVIDPRTLVPLDMDTIYKSVQKTNHVIVVHEAVQTCGIGAEIGMRIVENCFDYLDAPIKRVTSPDVPAPFSPSLEDLVLPGAEDIVLAAREVLAYGG